MAQRISYLFGDRVPNTPVEVSQTLDWEADGIRECDGLAGDAGVALCLETHGNLLASYIAETLHRAEAQNTYVNWHAAHHVRHGEPVNVAYVHLRGKVRHAHVNFGTAVRCQTRNAIHSRFYQKTDITGLSL